MLLKQMDLLRNTVDIHISQKFSGSSLAAEFSKLLITLIANQKCKLAVAAMYAKSGLKKLSSFALNEKFSILNSLSGLVPKYAYLKYI